MDGAQLLAYTKRRLGEYGLANEAGRDDELYAYITEGRDVLLATFADVAPVVVQQVITLEQDPANNRRFTLPAATNDPYRVLAVRAVTTGEELIPSSSLNQDGGHYEWRTIRELRLADDVDPPGGIEIVVVVSSAAIDSTTTESAVGVPTTCHYAIGKAAAVLALTADEESDASVAQRLLAAELQKLERLYGSYDDNGGAALRQALLQSYGGWLGDSLY